MLGTGTSTAKTYSLSTPNDPSAPKVARDMLTAVLATAGRPGTVDAAQVCVSDIVTNVIRRTAVPLLSVDVSVLADRVVVGVWDGDPKGRPRARPASDDGEDGRGLLIVQRLAHHWGVNWTGGAEPDGKLVWFELWDACGADCAHLAEVGDAW